MWLFTELGFFSIVKKGKGEWHLRARVERDLHAVAKLLPGDAKVQPSFPGSDYPFRIIIDKRQKSALFQKLARIEYGNFKSRIGEIDEQRDKLPALHDVWQIMRDYQTDDQP